MENEAQKLGKNLKRIRTKKGISQGDIVRSLGMDRAFISNIENGKTNPTLATIAKLAKALGVPIGDLIK
ncbi:DNA-binding protein [Candidatus Giovannonibacteria bacterium RIFCSPLOWO2_02_FULL_43_37]|nr:MAG: DNA-binding protein [Candidatus Giovannonibacteria bacterium RIFCSPLOWO2_02_FULL_43_37]